MIAWDEDIKLIVNRSFNSEWYSSVRKRFIANAHYNPETDLIENPNTYTAYIEGHSGQVEEMLDHVDFFRYCWVGMDQGIGEPDTAYLTNQQLTPRQLIAEEIVTSIKLSFPPGNIDISYKLILSSIRLLSDLLEDLKDNLSDVGYTQTLDDMNTRIVNRIRASTRNIVALYDLSLPTTDRLNFYLLQDELASLLFLLVKSGMLSMKYEDGRINSYTFVEKYFYCHTRNTSSPFSPLRGVSKKISDARRGDNINSVIKVFERLQEAYHKILKDKKNLNT